MAERLRCLNLIMSYDVYLVCIIPYALSMNIHIYYFLMMNYSVTCSKC